MVHTGSFGISKVPRIVFHPVPNLPVLTLSKANTFTLSASYTIFLPSTSDSSIRSGLAKTSSTKPKAIQCSLFVINQPDLGSKMQAFSIPNVPARLFTSSFPGRVNFVQTSFICTTLYSLVVILYIDLDSKYLLAELFLLLEPECYDTCHWSTMHVSPELLPSLIAPLVKSSLFNRLFQPETGAVLCSIAMLRD